MNHNDYIPRPEEDFDGWQKQYITELTNNANTWGILNTDPDYLALQADASDWALKYASGKKSAMPAHPEIVAKQTSRHTFEKDLRIYTKRHLIVNPLVTDADRAALGITIADTTRTRSHVPAYGPEIAVHKIGHGYQVIRVTDPTNPTTKEMPAGAIGANLFVSITPPPTGALMPEPSTFYFVTLMHKFDHEVQWGLSQIGKTAYYFACYVDVHGEQSPSSPIISAVIA